jgi:hypothetical protein
MSPESAHIITAERAETSMALDFIEKKFKKNIIVNILKINKYQASLRRLRRENFLKLILDVFKIHRYILNNLL